MKVSAAVEWLEAQPRPVGMRYADQPMILLKDDGPTRYCREGADGCRCGDRMDWRHPMTDTEIRDNWTGRLPDDGWISLHPGDMERERTATPDDESETTRALPSTRRADTFTPVRPGAYTIGPATARWLGFTIT